jgi:hypothetical protein
LYIKNGINIGEIMTDLTGGFDYNKLEDRYRILSFVFNNPVLRSTAVDKTIDYFLKSEDQDIVRWTNNLDKRLSLRSYIEKFCANANKPDGVEERPLCKIDGSAGYASSDYSTGTVRYFSLVEYLARHHDMPLVTIESDCMSTYDERTDSFLPDGTENLELHEGFILSDVRRECNFPVYSVGQAVEVSGMQGTEDQRFEAKTLLYFLASYCYFAMKTIGLLCTINGEFTYILDKKAIAHKSHHFDGGDMCLRFVKDFIKFFP